MGVTVGKASAETIAKDAKRDAALPEGSAENPILLFTTNDIVSMVGRMPPGVVQVTFRAPLDKLTTRGLGPYLKDQYGIG